MVDDSPDNTRDVELINIEFGEIFRKGNTKSTAKTSEGLFLGKIYL